MIQYCRSLNRLLVLICALVVGACATPGSAEDVLLKVDGNVTTALRLSRAEFEALPRTAIAAKDKSGDSHEYEGVDLAVLLEMAGVPLKEAFKGEHAAKYLQAKAADGYIAVFALPEFDHQDFIVADKQDGTPLPDGQGPLQIVAPEDRHQSRWVRELIELRIMTAN
ncbi:molybdopterin-dependent oxidoreductase [Dongia sp.]|uniref:molybdopterin-dependent oxidoreductase n=1 Tax=Dongia sp. TaxID=1977262 RepID=UPI0035B1D7CB